MSVCGPFEAGHEHEQNAQQDCFEVEGQRWPCPKRHRRPTGHCPQENPRPQPHPHRHRIRPIYIMLVCIYVYITVYMYKCMYVPFSS